MRLICKQEKVPQNVNKEDKLEHSKMADNTKFIKYPIEITLHLGCKTGAKMMTLQ